MIPQSFIDELQSRTDIAEVISGYIPVKRAGRNFKALCPFHGEKTPSFMISPQKQIFHCFGCGEGGGAIQFLMLYEKITFVEAIEILAKRCGMEVPQQKDDKSRIKNVLYEAAAEAVKFFHNNLKDPQASAIVSYLNQRGIDALAIEQFCLGYAPGRNSLIEHMRRKGFSLDVLEKASLITRQSNGYRDLFVDRVIFPIFDLRSRPIAFGARLWTEKKDAPKYINSLESVLYSKREQLFGLNFAKDDILKNDRIIIVEGYLDMIIPFVNGVRNIAASSGTALTLEQIRLIRRYTSNVVLIYDADKAGQIATLRALDLLLENDLRVKIVQLPPGFDPDLSVRKKGKEFFVQLINQAQDFFDYKLINLKNAYDCDSIEGKSKITQDIFATINKLKSEIEKYEYIRKLSGQLNIKEEILIAEFRRNFSSRSVNDRPAVAVREKETLPIAEKIILKVLFTNNKVFSLIKKNLAPADFISRLAQQVINYCFHNFTPDNFNSKIIASSLEDKILSGFITAIVMDEDIPQDKESFKASLEQIRGRRKKILQNQLKNEIKDAEKKGDSQRLRKLINDYKKIRQLT
jgi:DNA primase